MDTRLTSGAAMDKRITPSNKGRWKLVAWVVGILMAVATVWLLMPRGLRVAASHLQVGTATEGVFHDEIAVRARLEPLNSVLLDSIEEGRVEEVAAIDGSLVDQGDLLFRLSNPQRNLELLAREAELAQQISNRSILREAHESRRSEHVRRIADLEFDLAQGRRQLARYEELAAQKYLSAAELEAARDQQAHLERQMRQELERDRAESNVSRQALTQLDEAIGRLQAGLKLANATLDGLSVRAPANGRLTGFKLQVGETVKMGQHIGRIDDPSLFKLSALVDEFYLSRIGNGQRGAIRIDGEEYPVKVVAIFPQVKDGRFTVELVFAEAQPKSLNPGQSVDLRITMGEPSKALIIPNGAFASDTGGTWVFVVDGGQAERRNITTGRRSSNQIEVTSGLEPGERVIVSAYAPFGEAKTLAIEE